MLLRCRGVTSDISPPFLTHTTADYDFTLYPHTVTHTRAHFVTLCHTLRMFQLVKLPPLTLLLTPKHRTFFFMFTQA